MTKLDELVNIIEALADIYTPNVYVDNEANESLDYQQMAIHTGCLVGSALALVHDLEDAELVEAGDPTEGTFME